MTDSAGEEINFLNGDLGISETDNLDATDDADEESPESPVRRIREGLPPSFRMRHEAHYVDELMSRAVDRPATPDRDERPRRPAEPPAAAAPAETPPRTETAAPSPAAPGVALIASRLESALAHASAIGSQPATAASIAASVRTELARIARLARAAAILQEREAPRPRSVSAREIADAAIMATTPITRLSGIESDITVDDPAFTILAEPSLIVQGIAGTVDAIVDLLVADPRHATIDPLRPAPRISITLQSVKVRPAIIVDVMCPSLFVSSRQAERFFDNDEAVFPNAVAAGILLGAAAHVVRAHAGRADVKLHNGIGVTVTYVFPKSLAEANLT